jgi:hypothetical protein
MARISRRWSFFQEQINISGPLYNRPQFTIILTLTVGSDLLEAISRLVEQLGCLVAQHGRVQSGLKLLPAKISEVQVLVRLHPQGVPEQIGKVHQPLLYFEILLRLLLRFCQLQARA